jgi:hypothetical protein
MTKNYIEFHHREPEEIKKVTVTSTETEPIRRRRQTDPLPPIPDETAHIRLRPPTKPPTPSETINRIRPESLPPTPEPKPERKRPETLPPVSELKTVKLKSISESKTPIVPKPKVLSTASITKKEPTVLTTPATTISKVKPKTSPVPDNIKDNKEIQFLIHLKDTAKREKTPEKHVLDDAMSTTTETTETTLIDRHDNELKEEVEMLKRELETTKARCERAEREKSDILLRRLASMDTTSNRTAGWYSIYTL